MDTLVGGAGNDTFVADHTTLGVSDSIDGAGGINTLNYTDASTNGLGVSAAVVKNIQIINVRNVNGTLPVAATKETATVTFGAATNGQTVTIGGLTFTDGGTGSTAAQVAAFFTTSPPAGYVSTSTSGTQVVFTAIATGNLANLTVTGTAAGTQAIAVIDGAAATQGGGITDTVTATNFAGATDFNSNLSTNAVTFSGLTNGQKVGLIGNGGGVLGNVTAIYNATATTEVINIAGGTGPAGTTAPTITTTGALLATATINSTGAANTVGVITLAGTETALTINAATNLKAASVVDVALKTIVISGAATTVEITALLASTNLVSVDASGLTVGGAKVTIGSSTALATTFKGGVGNDTLTIAAGIQMTGASDGGAGTNTLSISDALTASSTDTSLTATTAVKFTNFQTLQVASSSVAGVDTTFDASLLAGVTSFNIGASTGGVLVSNLAANATVNLVGNTSGTSGTTLAIKTASVTNTDTLNFNINNASTATTGNVVGLTDAKLSVGNSISTLNIGSGGTILGTGAQNIITALNAGDIGITKIVITGAAPLSLNVNALTKSFTVDGSAATGGLTINASTVDGTVTGAAFTNINGGSANDTISGNTKFVGTQTIYGGGGGDIITLGTGHNATIVTSLVYKAGTDSLLDATGTAGSSGTGTANTGKMDVVTSFVTGSDKIDITAFNTTGAQKGVADKGTFSSLTAAIAAATASTTFFNDATNTQRVATEFHIAANGATDTYVVVDVNHNGVFDVAVDLGIKLTGTASVVAADFLA